MDEQNIRTSFEKIEIPLIKLIKTRRSIRSYMDKTVPRDVLEEIIECARFSPTALGREPWHFIVVTDRDFIKKAVDEIKKKLRLMLKLRFMLLPLYPDLKDKKFLSLAREKAYSSEDRIFYNAPVVIFISTPKKSTYGLKDSLLASQNIMLAAHGLGLGTCLIGFAEAITGTKGFLKRLNLPSGHKVHITLTLGYPKTDLRHLPQRRRDNLYYI